MLYWISLLRVSRHAVLRFGDLLSSEALLLQRRFVLGFQRLLDDVCRRFDFPVDLVDLRLELSHVRICRLKGRKHILISRHQLARVGAAPVSRCHCRICGKADAFGVLGLLPKLLRDDTIRYRLLQRGIQGRKFESANDCLPSVIDDFFLSAYSTSAFSDSSSLSFSSSNRSFKKLRAYFVAL